MVVIKSQVAERKCHSWSRRGVGVALKLVCNRSATEAGKRCANRVLVILQRHRRALRITFRKDLSDVANSNAAG